jgi:hypothetical protein
MNKYWDELLDIKNLYRGWHLARADATNNPFIEEKYYIDAFSADLKNNLTNIINKVKDGKYTPSTLDHMEIPKNSLLVRPGSHMNIEDRVVLQTIVYIIGEKIAKSVKPSVYSFRIKDKYKKNKLSMFKETELAVPFLPKKTIDREISNLEAWYYLWPAFDEDSKKAYKENGQKYLSVSDISAYFENIQIPILRDKLLSLLKDEDKVVNLLISFFEGWANKTHGGRPQWRGIPQGNKISSFLADIFLIDLDTHFEGFCSDNGAEYYRYMDDVRIFSKTKKDAKKAILELDRNLKLLHLNVQSGKTKVLQGGEIKSFLEDGRLDDINEIIEEIKKSAPLSKVQNKKYRDRIWALAREKVNPPLSRIIPRVKILSNNLDSRFFLRWCSALRMIQCPDYLGILANEIKDNADPRITSLAISAIRTFPRRQSFAIKLLDFLKADISIFPHQEATIIRGFRYLYDIPQSIIDYCYEQAMDIDQDYYVRMQSLYLLERVKLSDLQQKKLLQVFKIESDPKVKIALATNILKHKEENEINIKGLIFDPHDKIRNIGKYFWGLKWNKTIAKRKIRYLFKDSSNIDLKLCDNIVELYLISYSPMEKFYSNKKFLHKQIKDKIKIIKFPEIRNILLEIKSNIEEEEKTYLTRKKASTPVLKFPTSAAELKELSK